MKTAPIRTTVRKITGKKKLAVRKTASKKPVVVLPYVKALRDEALEYTDSLRFELSMSKTECCGIKEFTGMSSLKDVSPEVVVANLFRKMLYTLTHPSDRKGIKKEIPDFLASQLPAFVLFSEVTLTAAEAAEEDYYDDEDYDYITTNYLPPVVGFINNRGLGSVTETPEAVNPNTGNTIRAVIWKLDREELLAWWNKVGRFYTI